MGRRGEAGHAGLSATIPAMQGDRVARRTDMVRSRVRKLVRRGAVANLTRLLAKVRPE